jgi:hypothetical protein
MEAVSVAAGLPWSDSPACTHPLLAHLARLVNDACTDAGRQGLVGLVPALATAAPRDPALASARLAATVTDYALQVRPTPLLAHLHRAAAAELQRELDAPARPPRRVLSAARHRVFLHGPGARGVEQSVQACLRLPAPERDPALVALLRHGLAAATDTATATPTEATRQAAATDTGAEV